MSINHIFVDMDGVLCDFFGAACKLWGVDEASYPPGEWEIANVVGISVSEFWNRINESENFWRDIKPYPWASELVGILNASEIPWTISTSPARHPNSAGQKVEWIRRYIGDRFRDYMIGPQKQLLAATDRLIIDDNDENVSLFRAHGGEGILFPQRWNSLSDVPDGFGYVKSVLEDYLAIP